MATRQSSSEDSDILRAILGQVSCPSCHTIYTDPRLLKCLHAFCLLCIKALPVTKADNAVTITCCCCNGSTHLPDADSISNLPVASDVIAMTELYKSLLESHSPKSNPPLKDPLMQKLEYSKCLKHDRDLEMYCSPCNLVVCAVCVVKEHRQHECDLVTEIFPKYKHQLETKVDKVKEQVSLMMDEVDQLNARERDIAEQGAAIPAEVDTLVHTLTDAIQQAGKELKSRTQELVQGKLAPIITQRKEKETKLAQLIKFREAILKRLQEGTCQEILTQCRQLLTAMETISKQISTSPTQNPRNSRIETSIDFVPCKSVLETCTNIGEIVDSTQEVGMPRSRGRESAVMGKFQSFSIRLEVRPTGLISCHLVHKNGTFTIQCYVEEVIEHMTFANDVLICKTTPIYRISYTPTRAGTYSVHLQSEGQSIPCDVHTVHVLPKPQTVFLHQEMSGVSTPQALLATKDHLFIQSQDSIIIKNKEGGIVRSFGESGSAQGRLNCPSGLAVTGDNELLVADSDNHRLQVFKMDGTFVKCVGSHGLEALQFNSPKDVVIDAEGRVYVSDSANNRIQVLNRDLTFSHMFGGFGKEPGQFLYPCGISMDSLGYLYISDCQNKRIQTFTPSGIFVRQFGQDILKIPWFLAINREGTIFVSDITTKKVSMFTTTGKYIGSIENTKGLLLSPCGVAVDDGGRLYVSDIQKNQIITFHNDTAMSEMCLL